MNCGQLISVVVALALLVAAISGPVGAFLCRGMPSGCLEGWKAAADNALAAATTGGTLLAQLPRKRDSRDPEEPTP